MGSSTGGMGWRGQGLLGSARSKPTLRSPRASLHDVPAAIPAAVPAAARTIMGPSGSDCGFAANAAAGIFSMGDGLRRLHPHALLGWYTSHSLTCFACLFSVGNGSHIPVTSRGHSVLPTAASNFALNNVLIVPSIVRNLLSVRQFTHDNSCSIEFDAFGFSVKDLRTRRVILRCNSDGDLYTISAATPSTAQALAASSSLWHRRLGHPGSAAIVSLRNSHSIACNKLGSTLCHACQLGKHARLPFALLLHTLFLLLR